MGERVTQYTVFSAEVETQGAELWPWIGWTCWNVLFHWVIGFELVSPGQMGPEIQFVGWVYVVG